MQSLFPLARLQNLVASTWDHTPLLLSLHPSEHHRPRRVFRFENSWLLDPNLVETVCSGWLHYPALDITSKINYCIADMERWSKNNAPQFQKVTAQYRKAIEMARTNVIDDAGQDLNEMKEKLSCVLLQEDKYWRQRAKKVGNCRNINIWKIWEKPPVGVYKCNVDCAFFP